MRWRPRTKRARRGRVGAILRAVIAHVALAALIAGPAHAGDHGRPSTHAPAGHHGVGHDALHHWYKTLRHPGTGYECCDGKDCRPTMARSRDGALEVLVDGEWTRVPADSIIRTPPPDLRTHVCAQEGPWSPKVIFCVVLGHGV